MAAVKQTLWQWSGMGTQRFVLLFVLFLVFFLSGLKVVEVTHQNRVSFSQLQEMRDEANSLQVEWGQLLIEQSTFGLEGRIEQAATQQLKMRVPQMSRVVLLVDPESP